MLLAVRQKPSEGKRRFTRTNERAPGVVVLELATSPQTGELSLPKRLKKASQTDEPAISFYYLIWPSIGIKTTSFFTSGASALLKEPSPIGSQSSCDRALKQSASCSRLAATAAAHPNSSLSISLATTTTTTAITPCRYIFSDHLIPLVRPRQHWPIVKSLKKWTGNKEAQRHFLEAKQPIVKCVEEIHDDPMWVRSARLQADKVSSLKVLQQRSPQVFIPAVHTANAWRSERLLAGGGLGFTTHQTPKVHSSHIKKKE